MRILRKPGFTGLIFAMLIGGMLISAGRSPRGSFQATTSSTPTRTRTQMRATATALPSATSTQTSLTSTPSPTKPPPTRTPEPLPPPEEIGSTDGIVTWGMLMVTLILAVLLWHRPDWARKRPPGNSSGSP